MTHQSNWLLFLVRPSTNSNMTVEWTYKREEPMPDDSMYIRFLVGNAVEAFMRSQHPDWKVRNRRPC